MPLTKKQHRELRRATAAQAAAAAAPGRTNPSGLAGLGGGADVPERWSVEATEFLDKLQPAVEKPSVIALIGWPRNYSLIHALDIRLAPNSEVRISRFQRHAGCGQNAAVLPHVLMARPVHSRMRTGCILAGFRPRLCCRTPPPPCPHAVRWLRAVAARGGCVRWLRAVA